MPLSRFSIVLVLLVVLAAGWRVVAVGMGEHWARHQPQAASAWSADHSRALRRSSLAAAAEGQLQRAAELARRAIAANPLDGRAYAALARAEADGGTPDVGLAGIATRRWPLDPAAHAALADHHLREDCLACALPHIDALLRVRGDAREAVFPLLLEVLVRLPDPGPLAEWLGRNPPWRAAFLARAGRDIDDPAPMHRLMQALHQSAAPPSDAELRHWLARLERDGRFVEAWFAWVQSLPAERMDALGNLYNGSFEWPASGYGFDWRIARVAGARVEQANAGGSNGDMALRVAFQHQRVDFRHVSQLLLLPPGRYSLSGRVRLDALRNEHGLIWQVQCIGPRALRLGQSQPFRGASPWRDFDFDFEVPAADCPAQWLRLQLDARAAADRFIGGEAWFDALRIRRASR